MKRHAFAGGPLALGLLAASAALITGCGDDGGLPRRYPVSGRVVYKGEPVKKGTINFVPNDPNGNPAGGTIVDGYYKLATLNPDDGAIPGTYKVTVDDRQVDMDKLRAEADAYAKKKGAPPGMIPQTLQVKALKASKGSLPGKYQIALTSDVEVEVKAQSNTIDVDLKD